MMKILEVRDGFLKFNADNSIFLSSFILIDGREKRYIAQVIQIKHLGFENIAIAKILFLYDGSLQPYDRSLPPLSSNIKEFTFDILNNSINAKIPIIIGETLCNNVNVIIDSETFNKKLLISIDDKIGNNIITSNICKQFNNINRNTVIIDTLGVINAKKYKAGIDFKLPLNTESLAFLYKDCLNDATQDSKSLIIEIFKDLAEYSKSVPFVPFETLKNIIDDMVDNSHVFKLLVLKNKLAKFERLGLFAKNRNEVQNLDNILASKRAIIDLSNLDIAFQNRYLAYLYERIKSIKNSQVILELSNTISKKNLKIAMSDVDVSTTFITHSRFKYLNDIKNYFDNFIITPSFTNNEIFKIYNSFLSSMPPKSFLITGESLNYIPIISNLKIIDKVIPFENNEEPKITSQNDITENAENMTDNNIIDQSTENTDEQPTIIEEENNETTTLLNKNEEPEQEENLNKILEEKKLANEEIIANINEKSDAVIDNAIKTQVPMPANMFEDNEETYKNEEDIDENAPDKDNNEDLLVAHNNIENSKDTEVDTLEDLKSLAQENENDIEIEENDDTIDRLKASIKEVDEENIDIDEEEIQNSQEAIDKEEGISKQENVINTEEESNDSEDDDSDISNYANNLEEEPEDTLSYEDIEENGEIENIVEDELSDELDISEDEIISESDNNDDIDTFSNTINEQNEESITENESETSAEIPEDLDIDIDTTAEDNNTYEDNIIKESDLEDNEVITDTEESLDGDLEEIMELTADDINNDDIIVEMDDTLEDNLNNENIDEQIVKDVDKVFTTRKDDDISDTDLDFIDQINGNNEEILDEVITNEEPLEEISDINNDEIIDETPIEEAQNDNDKVLETRNTSTPVVPIYNANIPEEDMVMSDNIQQGDTVTHVKYGSGVVEKMIKYGNKTLLSINFDNFGRKLLDPTLTEIKKF